MDEVYKARDTRLDRTVAYTLELRVASTGTGGTGHVEIDGINVTGSITVPNTGGWQTWTSVFVPGIPMSAGSHVIRLVTDTNGSTGSFGNINFMRWTSP
jgi:carbohydrate binding protein with CBM6 domain